MLYLASQSPRRRELLARLGLAFAPLSLEVPERRAEGESPEAFVRRVARDKAVAGLAAATATAGPGHASQPAVVLGADTEVVLDDEVFGKPPDAAAAGAMLRRLSGRTHRVLSAVSLVSGDRECELLDVSEVTFADLDEAIVAAYVAGGEWRGKAGGYAIQGSAQAFIAHVSGSFSGVMGLPLHATATMLAGFGLHPTLQATA
jgi:septum formation protein